MPSECIDESMATYSLDENSPAPRSGMPGAWVFALVALTMTAFAANSLLCRVALKSAGIDAASFTTIRLLSGAAMLCLVSRTRPASRPGAGNWLSALALFAYAAAFSFAYVSLPAASGSLLLFGGVQATMIGHGLWAGERMSLPQVAGLLMAIGGLVGLVLPGLSAPPIFGSCLMLAAGVAWGIYSIRGKGVSDPLGTTAGNFLRSAPIALALSVALYTTASANAAGTLFAILSGAVTSGLGYAVWYTVLPELKATKAATVQLSVPVIAAVGAILFLGEPLTLRLVLASAAILGGIALVILEKKS